MYHVFCSPLYASRSTQSIMGATLRRQAEVACVLTAPDR
jgi:hypothetical protein